MGVRVLGVSLTTAQEILYWFLLPTLLRAALYIAEIALAVGVAQNHFAQGDLRWGFATIAVLYATSVTFFVATVSQPGAWDRETPRATALWFGARVAQLLLFPAWAVYRYGKRLFWSVEALMSRGTTRELALDKASQPSLIELYLFAHAFLHSAPQAALQLGVTFVQCRRTQPLNDTQVLSVLTSLAVLAMTLASFQRFESQRMAGRREPWRVDPATSLDRGKPATSRDLGKAATLSRPPTVTATSHSGVAQLATPRTDVQHHVEVHVEHVEGKEVTHRASAPSPESSRRSSASSSSTSSSSSAATSRSTSPTPPPAPTRPPRPRTPPPPPPSERLLPPMELASTPPLPTRRRTDTALEEDDPLGCSVAGVGWLLFLVSRYGAVLSLAAFRPGVVAGVLGAHVALAGLFLVRDLERRTVVKVVQRCSLAVVFLLCPLEYGVRFARAGIVFGVFLAVTCAEDIAMTLGWYLGDLHDADVDAEVDADAFWHGFVVAVVFTSRVLSLLCLALYVALLRPKVSTFYVD